MTLASCFYSAVHHFFSFDDVLFFHSFRQRNLLMMNFHIFFQILNFCTSPSAGRSANKKERTFCVVLIFKSFGAFCLRQSSTFPLVKVFERIVYFSFKQLIHENV